MLRYLGQGSCLTGSNLLGQGHLRHASCDQACVTGIVAVEGSGELGEWVKVVGVGVIVIKGGRRG